VIHAGIGVGIFPTQTQLGTYTFELASGVTNIFGQGLSQVYTGSFTISLPTISGTVTDTNGRPVAGVVLEPTGPASPPTTDANGNYAIGVPRGWWGQITPVLGGAAFIPSHRSYYGLFGSTTNQNFVLVPTIAPRLSATAMGQNLAVTWHGLAGVNYQGWWSTNPLDWRPLGNLLYGSNAWLQLQLPTNALPAAFVRVQAWD
jgi:Carboxypeptidase regulatory-like domain